MSSDIYKELEAIEAKLDSIPMSGSERVVATSALHSGFILVERVVWAVQKIKRIRALFAKPAFAR